MEVREEYKKKIIISCIILFFIGYVIGTVINYIVWKKSVDDTVDFLSNIQILGKGNYNIDEVKEQIKRIYEVYNEGDYFKTVEELKKLEKIYPNLQIEPEFQRLMKKIK